MLLEQPSSVPHIEAGEGRKMRIVCFLEMQWTESSALGKQPQMSLTHLCLEQLLFPGYLWSSEMGTGHLLAAKADEVKHTTGFSKLWLKLYIFQLRVALSCFPWSVDCFSCSNNLALTWGCGLNPCCRNPVCSFACSSWGYGGIQHESLRLLQSLAELLYVCRNRHK